ncbi:uncharacterized protein F5147DRAFT_578544 [Suillus discolor]|uniref:GDS1 winged helix domain-containing protein n=1 Tax=Suillus discolor TaxID=1912936 RepID=A0A9P7F4V0_9AGAM|nr:uncharacterized protein F5147DRAFT_578544 [Suillus discolor]KAG2106799.1 hypothetical protein F5147DRAFT_578544 [Suillus discolor]
MSDTSHSHNYGTRIRNNSILKPSARLRQSPQPRRIKPVPHPTQTESTQNQSQFPIFPLPNVMLHPEDATSKVFHAIGRCFLSVDNRAMTIKDLAEMTLNFGLVCQNVSAASQAITTYIRNHLSRCEAQQDHPLLLRHTLSGTPADDDLVPALHSRVGGAPLQRQPLDTTCPNQNIPTGRRTNFRRGTIVWYLSKASGVSCPFSRAGILLSNYPASTSNTKPRKQSHSSMEKCGEKRKRLISRRCQSASSSSDEEEDEPERPPKVKLTLRLRPSPTTTDPTDIIDLSHDTSSDDDVDMSPAEPDISPEPFCLPPYPRRSIAVPCYTPISPPSLQYIFPPPPIDQSRASASPPPDSDHEEDIDFDFSSDEEESRGVSVKVEDEGEDNGIGTSQNVRDMLDAWEDLDLNRARSYSSPESGFASVSRENESRHAVAPEVKVEELEMWEWEFDSGWAGACGEIEVKKEDAPEALNGLSLSPTSVPWSGFPLSPMSPLTPSPTSPGSSTGFMFHHSSALPGSPRVNISPLRPTHSKKPSLERKNSVLDWQDAELLGPDSVHITELELEWEKGTRRTRFVSPAPNTSLSPGEDCQMTGPEPLPERKDQVVVVHTCVPCDPPVSATQVEGIPVYQTTLPLYAPHTTRTLLRRLDTDFVNLTPLLAAFSPSPSPCATAVPVLPPSAVRFEHPNLAVAGVWVSLDCAREFLRTSIQAGTQRTGRPYFQDETLRTSVEVFLSDELVMRFPSALRDFWRTSKPGRMLGQFGVCFEGGRVVSQGSSSSSSLVSARASACLGSEIDFERGSVLGSSVDFGSPRASLGGGHTSIGSGSTGLRVGRTDFGPGSADLGNGHGIGSGEPPLSPTEAEMFRVLCMCPDWEEGEGYAKGDVFMDVRDEDADEERDDNVGHQCDKDTDADADVDVEIVEEEPRSMKDGRSLRRSKRVADAVARTRGVRPRMRGPRHA